MSHTNAHHTTVALLQGSPVYDADGNVSGRIAEFLVNGTDASTHVSELLLTTNGRMGGKGAVAVPLKSLSLHNDGSLRLHGPVVQKSPEDLAASVCLERDLLDQQIIDVHGRKVVRVNDVDLVWEAQDETVCDLRIAEVEVGMRGAARRLLKGLPPRAVNAVATRFSPRIIPWEFVDLIDRDPARRVRLKVAEDRLSRMHPSDIADILEELGPAERDAVFTSLNEEVAAEALEEVDPKLQRSLLEHMDSGRVADIVEEMDPAAAADLLSELSEERSDAILEQMEPEERQEVEDLLEFGDDEAAGLMTTEYVAVPEGATVNAAVDALRSFEGSLETVSEIYLVDAADHLKGVVNLSRILLAPADAPLAPIKDDRVHCCTLETRGKDIAAQFDKYNLRALPVLADDGSLAGVILAEHVIALLREGQ